MEHKHKLAAMVARELAIEYNEAKRLYGIVVLAKTIDEGSSGYQVLVACRRVWLREGKPGQL